MRQAKPAVVPPIVHDVLRSPGQPLDPATRVFMESRFSHEFSRVPVHSIGLQASTSGLNIGPANDRFEQEANYTAERIMQAPNAHRPEQAARINFNHVRVHTDANAAESAKEVNAKAYSVGNDIIFGKGEYALHNSEGKHLLAHELVHIMQQGNGSPLHLQRRIKVEDPDIALPGTPPKTNADEIQDYINALCPSFIINRSGADAFVEPSNNAFCSATPGGLTPRCLCDLHNSTNPEPWKIKIDDMDWPHTEKANRRVTVHSTRSDIAFGSWGGGANAGQRISQNNPRVLGHELCGHAWLFELGIHPPFLAMDGGRPSHDITVIIENQVAREMSGPGVDQRGTFSDPHHGESFARVTLSSYPSGSPDVYSLPPIMQARLNKVRDFMQRDTSIMADIIGHADHPGSSSVNVAISRRRAQNVRNWLVASSIHTSRFKAVMGKSDTECPPVPPLQNPDCRKVDIFMFAFEAASENSP